MRTTKYNIYQTTTDIPTMSDLRGFNTRRKAAVAIGVLALILQIVGCVTPGWAATSSVTLNRKTHISVGLWVMKSCRNDDCETFPLSGVYTLDEFRVETIIGIISMFAAIVAIMLLLRDKNPTYGCGKALVLACLASVLSYAMALAASAKFGYLVLTVHIFEEPRSPLMVSYSIIILGLGGILAALVLILLLFETCFVNSREVTNHQCQNVAIATSSQSFCVYAVQAQNSMNQQPAGATSLYTQRDTEHLAVSKSPSVENDPVTRL